MFEFNNIDLSKNEFVYTMDNFFVDPNSIVSLLENNEPELWKEDEQPSYNGKHFLDQRHFIKHENIFKIKNAISQAIGLSGKNDDTMYSNITKFIDKNFNDYQNNYWFPHIDNDYVALIYLNQCKENGTNIYERIEQDVSNVPEHYMPWRSKSKYKLLTTIEAEYNRLVVFDGRYFHGMNIENDRYFSERRMNVAMFIKRL